MSILYYSEIKVKQKPYPTLKGFQYLGLSLFGEDFVVFEIVLGD